MELFLIRHGQSEADILNVHEGKADFPLTDLGIKQAKSLGSYLTKFHQIDIVWSSTLIRAAQTSEILRTYLDCPIMYDDRLQERNNGILAGKPITEGNVDTYYSLKPFERIEEGESDLEFRARVESILFKIIDNSKKTDRIAIVSHGGTIEKCIHSLLHLPTVNRTYFYTGDTGIHLLEYHDSNMIIKYLNRTEHLNDVR